MGRLDGYSLPPSLSPSLPLSLTQSRDQTHSPDFLVQILCFFLYLFIPTHFLYKYLFRKKLASEYTQILVTSDFID